VKTRVVIVDDSAFIRRILSDWIQSHPDFELVGTATNGEEAVELAHRLRPDVMSMDIEMPKRDGLSALGQIMRECPTRVLMASSLTTQGATATLQALELGAVDFVTKSGGSLGPQRQDFLERLKEVSVAKLGSPLRKQPRLLTAKAEGDRVVVIASSTGGPKALSTLWSCLPPVFPAPILVVQHMPPGFTTSFAARLNSLGTVPCVEAKAGDPITVGQAYLAPGGFHMTLGEGRKIVLDERATLHGVRPAADYLFASVADHYGANTIAVVMTGMGRDGADGAAQLKRMGARTLGQDEATSTIYGMPRAAKEAGGIDAEFPLDELAAAIVASLGRKKTHAA